MLDAAFIQEEGNGRLSLESQLVRDHCVEIGLPVQLYTRKRIERRQLPLDHRAFVFGDMDCTHGAMRQLGIPVPEPDDYPDVLTPYLHRKVWLDTLGRLRSHIDEGGAAVFAKPASRRKIFTGRVFSNHSDFYHTGGTSRHERIWCSEPVAWRSEYRVYVNGTEIVAVDHYDGDAGIALDLAVVRRAIADYSASPGAPIAYGIDFGVLATGETALVEANDGFALGAYGIDGAAYTEVMLARWRQLIALATAEDANPRLA